MQNRRAVTDELTEANYLIGHQDGPYYRLLMRCFYERHRMHANYVRSDELGAYVRQYLPYDEADCRRHLEMLERWGLIVLLPEQSKPNNLLELRQKPRTYRAERLALRLEALRVEEEEGEGAAALDPAALDLLVQRVKELLNWLGARGPAEQRSRGSAADVSVLVGYLWNFQHLLPACRGIPGGPAPPPPAGGAGSCLLPGVS